MLIRQRFVFANVDIVAEESIFDSTIRESHDSEAMLDAPHPVTIVKALVCPPHLSLPMSLVILEVTFITVPRSPGELSVAVLFVHEVLALEDSLVAYLALRPLTLAMLQSVMKITNIDSPIRPFVLAFPFRSTIGIVSNVNISVREVISALALLHAVPPFALVLVSVGPDVDTVAMSLR